VADPERGVVAFEYVEDTDDPAVVLARDRRQVESLFHAPIRA
jgi:hypothetical protein